MRFTIDIIFILLPVIIYQRRRVYAQATFDCTNVIRKSLEDDTDMILCEPPPFSTSLQLLRYVIIFMRVTMY